MDLVGIWKRVVVGDQDGVVRRVRVRVTVWLEGGGLEEGNKGRLGFKADGVSWVRVTAWVGGGGVGVIMQAPEVWILTGINTGIVQDLR